MQRTAALVCILLISLQICDSFWFTSDEEDEASKDANADSNADSSVDSNTDSNVESNTEPNAATDLDTVDTSESTLDSNSDSNIDGSGNVENTETPIFSLVETDDTGVKLTDDTSEGEKTDDKDSFLTDESLLGLANESSLVTKNKEKNQQIDSSSNTVKIGLANETHLLLNNDDETTTTETTTTERSEATTIVTTTTATEVSGIVDSDQGNILTSGTTEPCTTEKDEIEKEGLFTPSVQYKEHGKVYRGKKCPVNKTTTGTVRNIGDGEISQPETTRAIFEYTTTTPMTDFLSTEKNVNVNEQNNPSVFIGSGDDTDTDTTTGYGTFTDNDIATESGIDTGFVTDNDVVTESGINTGFVTDNDVVTESGINTGFVTDNDVVTEKIESGIVTENDIITVTDPNVETEQDDDRSSNELPTPSSIKTSKRPVNDGFNLEEFLMRFGYLPRPKDAIPSFDDRQRREAIRKFQRLVGLPETGELDQATLAKMGRPRCGVPDFNPYPNGTGELLPSEFHAPGAKWKRNMLTWRSTIWSKDMDEGAQRRNIHRAFQLWSDVTPLVFEETRFGQPDIEIKFSEGEHGDGYWNKFDGPGGVLAHAFYPENGDTHFDDAETFTENSYEGTNLLYVAAHEFGHALGLGHSGVRDSLMAPYYRGYDPDLKLHSDDIRGIQSLYGPKTTLTTTTESTTTETTTPSTTTEITTTTPEITTTTPEITTTTPEITTTTSEVITTPTNPLSTTKSTTKPKPTPRTTKRPPRPVPDKCKSTFDGILEDFYGDIYAFRSYHVWKLNANGGIREGFPKLTRKLFQKPPRTNTSAAVYSWRTGRTYLFKGKRVWIYYGMRLAARKHVYDANFPYNPDAAIAWRDGRIYLFKGSYYWIFDEIRWAVDPRTPRPIKTFWPGIPSDLDGAFMVKRSRYSYFFKGDKYWQYDDFYRMSLPDFPKSKASRWMGCERTDRWP